MAPSSTGVAQACTATIDENFESIQQNLDRITAAARLVALLSPSSRSRRNWLPGDGQQAAWAKQRVKAALADLKGPSAAGLGSLKIEGISYRLLQGIGRMPFIPPKAGEYGL